MHVRRTIVRHRITANVATRQTSIFFMFGLSLPCESLSEYKLLVRLRRYIVAKV